MKYFSIVVGGIEGALSPIENLVECENQLKTIAESEIPSHIEGEERENAVEYQKAIKRAYFKFYKAIYKAEKPLYEENF